MDIVLEGKASCSSFIECQKLEDSLRELKVDLLASELLVHRGEGLCLVLDVGLLGLVQVNLEEASSVQADPENIQFEILTKGLINLYLILFPTISAG